MSGQRGRPRGQSKYEYALYKGDNFLDIGTARALSEKWRYKIYNYTMACTLQKKPQHQPQRRICSTKTWNKGGA